MYELTNDRMYLDKAEQLGKILSATFRSSTGLPRKFLDMSTYGEKLFSSQMLSFNCFVEVLLLMIGVVRLH
jgi:hypothetical protein